MEIERCPPRRPSNEREQGTSDKEVRHREDLNDMSTVEDEPRTSSLNKNNIESTQPSKKRKKVSLTKAVNVPNETPNPINLKKGGDSQGINSLTAGKSGTIDTSSNNRISQKYNNKDEGPFAVLLTIDRESNNNVPSPVEIGRFLFQCGIKFNEINKLSRFCWKIVFDSYHEANQSLENEFIKKSKYRLQIPDWMVSRCVVIRGIPTDITEKEILEEISCRNPFLRPIKAERLKRRETINNTYNLVDSKSIKMTLRTRRVPLTLKLWNTINHVEIFVPRVRICLTCGKIGHTSKFCRSHPCCRNCGDKEHDETPSNCTLPPRCKNCNGAHRSLDGSCPEMVRRRSISKIMAMEGIDFFSARRKFDENKNNQSNLTLPGNFPSLPAGNSSEVRKVQHANHQISGKSYAQIISEEPRPSYVHIPTETWIKFIKQLGKRYLICGDINAHHASWGSSSTNADGSKLFEALVASGSEILNNGKPTFFSSRANYQSAIDISFCNSDLVPIFKWNVLNHLWGSDHFAVEIGITEGIESHLTFRGSPRLYGPCTDWDAVRSRLAAVSQDLCSVAFDSNLDLECKYTTFMAVVVGCLGDADYRRAGESNIAESQLATDCFHGNSKGSPKRNFKNLNPKNKNNKTKNYWWNQDCDRIMRLRKAAFLKLKFAYTWENFIKYKKMVAKTKRELKSIKKESFIKFCETLNKNSNIKYAWQKIKRMSCNLDRGAKSNEYKPDSYRNVLRAIESLCPPWVESPAPSFSNPRADSYLDNPFFLEELNSAIDQARPDSNPGPDRVGYPIYQALDQRARYAFLGILNDVFASGTFPKSWNRFDVFFLPKKDTDKYRPITLAQCLLKITERMLANRLNWWVERHSKLPKTQFGFRTQKACADSLSIFHTEAALGLEKHEDTAALFLDIQGAYDNVLCDILIENLKTLGLPPFTLKFIYNLVNKRNIHIKFGYIDETLVLFRGLPQGCVLSPLLYSLYVTKLDHIASLTPELRILQFADDVCIYARDRDVNTALETLEEGANRIAEWLNGVGLSLAPHKSNLCIFSKSPKTRKERGIEINEIADSGARRASREGDESSDPIPASDLGREWRENAFRELQEVIEHDRYISSRAGKYYNCYYEPSRRPWFWGKELSRRAVVSINRIRAGRTSLADDLYGVGIVDSPLCGCQKANQTINHVIWQCEIYNKERAALLRALHGGGSHGPFWVEEILSTMEPEILRLLAIFLTIIKIKI